MSRAGGRLNRRRERGELRLGPLSLSFSSQLGLASSASNRFGGYSYRSTGFTRESQSSSVAHSRSARLATALRFPAILVTSSSLAAGKLSGAHSNSSGRANPLLGSSVLKLTSLLP